MIGQNLSHDLQPVWFIALWATFQSLYNYFAQVAHILGNFCKSV